jgi:hypothetical protein
MFAEFWNDVSYRDQKALSEPITHRAETICAAGHLANDPRHPLALRLGARHKITHDNLVDVRPVLTCADGQVRDNVHLCLGRQARAVAKGARLDVDDTLDLRAARGAGRRPRRILRF